MGVDSSQQQQFTGNWVWKVCTLPKIRCFLWQCTHWSIPVREVLAARGINTTVDCPLCNIAPESIIHVLRDYQTVRAFWNALSPLIQSNIFFDISMEDWLRLNCQAHQPSVTGIPWGIIFSFGVWNLWLHRNIVVFKTETLNRLTDSKTIARAI